MSDSNLPPAIQAVFAPHMPLAEPQPPPPAAFPFRAPCAIRTLLDTAHGYDAGVCGYDGPTPVEDGGVRVTFDGRDVPTVTINGSDGEVCICGAGAIEALANALLQAERLANLQGKVG